VESKCDKQRLFHYIEVRQMTLRKVHLFKRKLGGLPLAEACPAS